jgi:general secretion pathway protein A
MYKNFFGFKERPFQLVPNPAYLFLSRTHEEAMAHLTYALSQGDGFIELTGEVGTGKTTICRTFLENLDDRTEAAYVFNPKLDSLQLLRTINQEFGIPAAADNSKDLIDQLNEFLLRKKAEGTKVILVIDEAQNLNKDVLEQLRLLSNLETTTSKLLQIVLVGQPELGEMLDSPELRQLSQRITLSCHLHPLSFKETREYIRHRIHVASQKQYAGFTWAAIRIIHGYSRGIPRLINIACDRALLTAFGLNRKKVTGSIARASVRELASRGEINRSRIRFGRKPVVLTVLVFAALLAVLYRGEGTYIRSYIDRLPAILQAGNKQKPIIEAEPAVKEIPTRTQESVPASKTKEAEKQDVASAPISEPLTADKDNLGNLLMSNTRRESRSEAMKAALALWFPLAEINPYLEGLDDDQAYFRLVARQNGLLIHRLEGGWSLLEKLNIPVVLELRASEGQEPRYLSLSHIEEEAITLGGLKENTSLRIRPEDVQSYWTKVSYVLWKDYLDYPGTIPMGASRESVIALKMLLQDIGFKDLEISPFYDEKTRGAVMAVQEKHGIRVDGVVGPLTKIVLYKEKVSLKMPLISR